MTTNKLFGIPLYRGTYADFFHLFASPSEKMLIATPNPEIFVRTAKDPEFHQVLQSMTHNVPDGNGLYIGYMMRQGKTFLGSCLRVFFQKKKVYTQFGELVKGSDLTRDLLLSCAQHPKKILVIDRKNAVPKNDFEHQKALLQQNLSSLLEQKYPGTTVFVVFAGEQTPQEIADLIMRESISHVISCIGMKYQEKILLEVFSLLPKDFPVAGIGAGASIDFLLGLQKRAPVFFQKYALEWLYRLGTQPKIRAKRIWDATYHFYKLLKNTQE